MFPKRLCVVLIMLLGLTGCGGPRAVLGLGATSTQGGPAAIVPIYVATTRARSDNLSLPYSAERSKTLNFAKFDIGIPQNHVVRGTSKRQAASPIRAGILPRGRISRSPSDRSSSGS
jgi:esterase/lipase superfamily enzyme